jgi:hypothetical protein
LLTDYDAQSSIYGLLAPGPVKSGIQLVIDRYRPESPPDQKGIHFSQGKIGPSKK